MNELDLVKFWNDKRNQIINAQRGPTIVLAVVITLSALGKFNGANNATKYFALGVVVASGLLATITQYATMREAGALCDDLAAMKDLGGLGKTIASSKASVSLTIVAIVGLDIGVFALAAWAVLGK
jgi:hypothetical protein